MDRFISNAELYWTRDAPLQEHQTDKVYFQSLAMSLVFTPLYWDFLI